MNRAKAKLLASAITNPIEPEIKQAIMAANVMMGHGENCLTWIRANRQEAAEERGGGEGQRDQRERRHRRGGQA